jgi:hypothetical protein
MQEKYIVPSMPYIENEIPEKVGYIIPIGDIHIGDKAFDDECETKLRGYINWVKEEPGARVILMGDIFNVPTRGSKTSPFAQNKEEFDYAINLFKPIANKIAVALDGNHEARLLDFANFSIMNSFCQILEIPYGGISTIVNFKVRKSNRKETKRGEYRMNYYFYAHHTTGGGSTIGGKMNRVDKLRQLVCNADVYLGAHNHMLGVVPVTTGVINASHKKVDYPQQWLVDCGSYLKWEGSYAEAKQLPPNKLGSPKIRLDGLKKDIHVSL